MTEEHMIAESQNEALQEWTPRFAISVDEAVKVVEQKRQFMERVMRRDEHYGVIPGTGTKPALLKPGAELLLSSMGLRPELIDAAPPIEDWTGDQHGGESFLQYRRACIIWRQTGFGPDDKIFIARAEGSCSSWEKKYRYRTISRSCPVCGQATIIRGKVEFGGGWLCWKKKGGCGQKFGGDDVRITKQESGQIVNPDVADLANTILKMADKRALVAATLVATGCSDIFAQDIEDIPPDDLEGQQSERSAVAVTSEQSTAPKASGGQKAAAAMTSAVPLDGPAPAAVPGAASEPSGPAGPSSTPQEILDKARSKAKRASKPQPVQPLGFDADGPGREVYLVSLRAQVREAAAALYVQTAKRRGLAEPASGPNQESDAALTILLARPDGYPDLPTLNAKTLEGLDEQSLTNLTMWLERRAAS